MSRNARSKGWLFALGVLTVVAATACLDVFLTTAHGKGQVLSAERKATIVAGTTCNCGLITDFCIAPLGCDYTVGKDNCGSGDSACIGVACDDPGQTNNFCNEVADFYSVADCQDFQNPSGCGNFLDNTSCKQSPTTGDCACTGTSSQRGCLSSYALYNPCKPE